LNDPEANVKEATVQGYIFDRIYRICRIYRILEEK